MLLEIFTAAYLALPKTSSLDLSSSEVPLKLESASFQTSQTVYGRLQQEGFVFEIKECKKISKQPLTCKLLIKNIESTRRRLVFRVDESRLIDSTGKVIRAKEGKLGDNTSNSTTENNFPYDIPIQGSISFGETPQKIEVIELTFHTTSGDKFILEFRPNEAKQL